MCAALHFYLQYDVYLLIKRTRSALSVGKKRYDTLESPCHATTQTNIVMTNPYAADTLMSIADYF